MMAAVVHSLIRSTTTSSHLIMRKVFLSSQKVIRSRRISHRLAVVTSEERLEGVGGEAVVSSKAVVVRRRSSKKLTPLSPTLPAGITTTTTPPPSDSDSTTIQDDSDCNSKPKGTSRRRSSGSSSHFSSTPPPPPPAVGVTNSGTTTTADDMITKNTHKTDTDITSSLLSFTIYGDPVALSRHRATTRGIMYNPSAKLQKDFLDACQPFLPSQPLDGPLDASLIFFITRPKSHYGTGRNAGILKPEIEQYHSKKPGSLFPLLPQYVYYVLATYNDHEWNNLYDNRCG